MVAEVVRCLLLILIVGSMIGMICGALADP